MAEGAEPRATDLAPTGAWLGPWEVLGPLGRGGFAEVVRARRQDGLEAALKVSRDRERVRPDPSLGAHPHIVATLEADLDHDPPWVALELAPGGSLRGSLRAGRPGPRVALRLVTEVAAALDHAHGRGVLHLDLKPENVLLDGPLPAGRVRLADFGAVRPEPRVEHSLLLGASQAGGVARTRDYAAPELLEGGVIDRRADVWGLGALAFELLTGRRPVGLDRPTDLVRGLPRAVDEVLAHALAADPARRPASAGALARDLAAALADAETADETPTVLLGAGASPRDPRDGARRSPAVGEHARQDGGPRPRESRLGVGASRRAAEQGPGRRLALVLAVWSLLGLLGLVGGIGWLAAPVEPPPSPHVRPEGRVAALLDAGGLVGPVAVLPTAPTGPAASPDPAGDEALRRPLVDELTALGAAAPVAAPQVHTASLHERDIRLALTRSTGAALLLDPVRAADGGEPHLLLVELAGWRVAAASAPRTPGLLELGRRIAGWVEAGSQGHERSLALLPLEGAGLDQTSLHAELVGAVVAARAPRLVVRPRVGADERLRTAGPAGLAARLLLVSSLEVRPGQGRLLRVALSDVETHEVLGSATVELP